MLPSLTETAARPRLRAGDAGAAEVGQAGAWKGRELAEPQTTGRAQGCRMQERSWRLLMSRPVKQGGARPHQCRRRPA